MTTIKQKKQQEAEAYLSISDPRTGVKSWGERKRLHEAAAVGDAPKYDDMPTAPPVDTAEAIERCKRFGLATDQASLDHAVVYQEGRFRTAALDAGGSVNRFNARHQLQELARFLPARTDGRHTVQGGIAYRKLHRELVQHARALADLGGEKATIPPLLESEEVRVII